MQIRNNYTLETFNGDVGCIVAFDEDEALVIVRFEDRLVEYDLGATSELSLAYACTVHKAQGSEYPIVVIVMHSQHHIMLQRNLLYTAVTRARRQVVLVGQRRALATGLRQLRREKRHTRLQERFRDAWPACSAALTQQAADEQRDGTTKLE
jgi:exodeoxyribonuclease V alpha subunit